MNRYSDTLMRDILTATRVIAVVGFSANPDRPSHSVARYLQMRGYLIRPVNPGLAGQCHLGEPVYGTLAEVPDDVDMVDIFRQSDAVPGIVDAALASLPHLRTIWMQLGVRHPEAARQAEARGIAVVQDRCPKIEYERLMPSR